MLLAWPRTIVCIGAAPSSQPSPALGARENYSHEMYCICSNIEFSFARSICENQALPCPAK